MADTGSVCIDSGSNEGEIFETSRYFSSIIELIPVKYYIQNSNEETDVRSANGKRKKLKPENKKLLTKKAKLLKLNPANHKSIAELQEEIDRKENEYFAENNSSYAKIKPIKVSSVPSASIEELREKLHAKMTNLRGKRKLLEGEEKTEFKKSRLDQRVKDSKKKKKITEGENIKRANIVEEKSLINQKIKNDKGEVVFSKFDFALGPDAQKKKKKKDMNKLLHIAEKQQEKIRDLENTDILKATTMKKELAWENAVKKAEGQKLKDNPKLLKKAIKRKEKIKEQSQKKWKERIETVEKQKKEKQKKRREHLIERKEDKQKKKNGNKKSKKKSRPGF